MVFEHGLNTKSEWPCGKAINTGGFIGVLLAMNRVSSACIYEDFITTWAQSAAIIVSSEQAVDPPQIH